MIMDVMWNDESCDGNVSVEDLTWRSGYVNSFFQKLDKEAKQNRSDQARGQTKVRIIGASHSEWPKPQGLPTWATNQE